MEREVIATENLDDLEKVSDRLYCISQALVHGNDDCFDHESIIGRELTEAWLELDRIIDNEKTIRDYVREEMDKFTQGFAYGRTKGMCAGREECSVRGVEH